MSRLSFWAAHLPAGAVLLTCMVAAPGMVVAVLPGPTSVWLLLLAALLGWYGITAIIELRSWFGRIPEERFAVDARWFLLDGVLLPFDRVSEIRGRAVATDKRMTFTKAGRDFTVLATIAARDGRTYRLRAGQGPVTWFGPTYGARRCRTLMDKLRSGHERTSASWTAE